MHDDKPLLDEVETLDGEFGMPLLRNGSEHVCCWPITSFTALQKGGRYRINSGQTAPSGLTNSAAFDPFETWPTPLAPFSDSLIRSPRRRAQGGYAGCETERLGGLEIDDEIEFGRLLDRDDRQASSRAESCRHSRRRAGTESGKFGP